MANDDRNKLLELMHLQDEYEGTEARAIFRDVENLARTFGVFHKNRAILEPALARFKRDYDFAIDLMRTGGNMHGFLRSLDQPLHNYLASAATLLDHQRVLKVKRLPRASPEFAEYNERVTSGFKNDPLAQFVQRLRNYLLHFSLPATGGTMRFNESSVEHAVHLSSAHLLQWSEWTAPARAFLEAQGEDEVDLHEVVATYSERAVAFHYWFSEAVLRANWIAIQAADPLARRINVLVEEVRPQIEAIYDRPTA